MKHILIILTLMFSIPAFAEYTPEQIHQIEQMKKTFDEVNHKDAIPKKVEKVVKTVNSIDTTGLVAKAEEAADAILAFLSKFGIAIEEFIKSPAGFFLTLVGAIYFFGDNILLLFICYIWIKKIIPTTHKVLVKMWGRGKHNACSTVKMSNFSGDTCAGYILIMGVMLVVPFGILLGAAFH